MGASDVTLKRAYYRVNVFRHWAYVVYIVRHIKSLDLVTHCGQWFQTGSRGTRSFVTSSHLLST